MITSIIYYPIIMDHYSSSTSTGQEITDTFVVDLYNFLLMSDHFWLSEQILSCAEMCKNTFQSWQYSSCVMGWPNAHLKVR